MATASPPSATVAKACWTDDAPLGGTTAASDRPTSALAEKGKERFPPTAVTMTPRASNRQIRSGVTWVIDAHLVESRAP
jgi:hypothetical protein